MDASDASKVKDWNVAFSLMAFANATTLLLSLAVVSDSISLNSCIVKRGLHCYIATDLVIRFITPISSGCLMGIQS